VVGNKLQLRFWQVLGNVLLLFAVVLLVMPYLYMISASFKEGSEIFSIPIKILPEGLYMGNYDLLFGETNFVRWFFNSVFVSLSRAALAIVVSIMAGYAFAKYHFRFKNLLFLLVIATLTLPIYVLIVPLYDMMVTLGWTDRYIALILPFAAQAIGVFLARQYLLSIPDEILDAARVDGATEWGVFWRVVLPLSTPVMAVLGILFLRPPGTTLSGRWS
jgi:ABC-type glycerol-3-phosphate transport system permease component